MNELAELLQSGFHENVDGVLRLCVAGALGGLIGLEREASGKAAGFRTHLLICLGAALITELSISVAALSDAPGSFRADPGRIAAQVVSGIGFIGAGTIMQARGSITGLTTAATMWVVAAVGMAAGAGAWVHAVSGTLLVILALRMLGRIEALLIPHRSEERTVRVLLDPDPSLITRVEQALTAEGFRLVHLELERSADGIAASYSTRGRPGEFYDLAGRLLSVPGVRRVTTT